MGIDADKFVLLLALTFTAGFIDAVAGGGGLIAVPAYFLTGLPPRLALGGNKLSACFGTFCAILRFWKNRRILWREALSGMGGAFVGAALGTSLAFLIDGEKLKLAIALALPFIAAAVLGGDAFKRDPAGAERPGPLKSIALATAVGLGVGAYDGLIGPGTGTFLIILSTLLLKIDLVTSSGNAKVINFASNLASVIVFAVHGSIPYKIALPAAAASILGGYLGVGFCVRRGSQGVRKMLVIVLILLFARLAWDVVRNFWR